MNISIQIQNFRSIDNVTIDLKKIVFLFGPNGSGKSSFIYALKFLHINLFPLNLWEPTKYKLDESIDLGGFEETVKDNDITKEIVFTITIQIEKESDDSLIYSEMSGADEHRDSDIYSPYSGFNFQVRITFGYENNGFNLNDISLTDLSTQRDFRITRDAENPTSLSDNHLFKENDPYIFGKTNDECYSSEMKIFFDDRDPAPLSNLSLYNPFKYNIKYLDLLKVDKKKRLVRTEQGMNTIKSILEEYLNNGNLDDSDVIVVKQTADLFFSWVPAILRHSIQNYLFSSIRMLPRLSYHTSIHKIDSVYYNIPDLLYVSQQKLRSRILQKHGNGEFGNLYSHDELYHIIQDPRQLFNCLSDDVDSYNDTIMRDLYELNQDRELKNTAKYQANNSYDFREEYLFYKLSIVLNSLKLAKYIYLAHDEASFQMEVVGLNDESYGLANASSGMLQILPIITILVHNSIINYNPHFHIENKGTPKFIKEMQMLSCIQQPELHLHPKLQAMFVEFLAGIKNNSVILETHSEHMVRKLQVLIAKGEISAENVAVYFFDKKNGSTNCRIMEMDKRGLFLEDWPDGFFDDSMNLTLELYEALKLKNQSN